MFDRVQKAIALLAKRHEINQQERLMRETLAGLKRTSARIAGTGMLSGMAAAALKHRDETESWITHASLEAGNGGPFDSCDLRHWIALSKIAGVPYVPAQVILEISHDEISSVSQSWDFGPAISAYVSRALTQGDLPTENAANALIAALEMGTTHSPDDVAEKLAASMDTVPDGWMVRNVRIGSSILKALAGAGHAHGTCPEIELSKDFAIGPGWVRIGNRRSIDPTDLRTLQGIAGGPTDSTAFVARPWIKSSEYVVATDPHRAETPYDGPGIWPVEWRAFVEGGKVYAVSAYYSWAGSVNKQRAGSALSVREMAQKIADVATAAAAFPRFMELEFARAQLPMLDERFPREGVAFTMDFIETADGLLMLEAGPPYTPIGGGHPCGFAGCGTEFSGVALKNMAHVRPGDTSTWEDGDRANAVFTWEEIQAIAAA